MEMANIPNDARFVAVVNAATDVVLYNREGEAMTVPASKEGYWLTRGFRRTVRDIAELLSEVHALAAAVDDPWVAYAAACQASGFIDGNAQEVAIHALQLLSDACNNLHLALHSAYRTRGADE